jgi:hypothetical protein
MTIQKVARKIRLEDQSTDFLYWQSQPYEKRLAALEEIRREFHLWMYGYEPKFQRVCTIINKSSTR